MVRSWVESRRRGLEDPLTNLTASAAVAAPVSVSGSASPAAAHPAQSPYQNNAQSHYPAHQAATPALATQAAVPAQPRLAPRAQALVSVIRGIGAPLQSAVSEVAAGLRDRGQPITQTDEARAYAQLVQQVVSIGRTTSSTLEIGRDAIARWNGEPLRWSVMEAISDIAGAHFRATGLLQPSGIVGQIVAAVVQIAIDGARREDMMPGLGNATQARLGLDMLKATPPVVHAITRFAFGRNPLVLVTEVAWELQYKAVECTRRLLAAGSTLDEWHAVYGAFIVSAGQLYAESHFAEAERLSRLPQHERNAMGAGELSMTAVWDAFDRKVDLLANFAGYMAVPAESGTASAHAAAPTRITSSV